MGNGISLTFSICSGFFFEIFLSADLYRLCKFKSSPLKPLNQICVWWSRPLTKMAAQLYFPSNNVFKLHKMLTKLEQNEKQKTRGSQEPVIAHLDQSCFQ
jgi:hypothetical protein